MRFLEIKLRYWHLIWISCFALAGCYEDSYNHGPAPDIYIESFSNFEQKLQFKIIVGPYNHPADINGIGVCYSELNEIPDENEDIMYYTAHKLSTPSKGQITVVPGRTYYFRPFVEIGDEITFGETITYTAGAAWSVIKKDFIDNYNRFVVIINENDIRFFSRSQQYKSVDQGVNWESVVDNLPNETILFVKFFTENDGIVITASGEKPFYKTTDGGLSWTLDLILATGFVNAAHFITSERGTVAADNKRIKSTSNGGDSWTTIPIPIEDTDKVTEIYTVDNDVAFLATEEGDIFRTLDAGYSWTFMNEGDSILDVTDMYFFDENHGFLLANRNIYETFDGGASHSINFYDSRCYPLKIEFLNDLEGFAVGKSGTCLKTTNGGLDWLILMHGGVLNHPESIIQFDMLSNEFGMGTTIDKLQIVRYSNH